LLQALLRAAPKDAKDYGYQLLPSSRTTKLNTKSLIGQSVLPLIPTDDVMIKLLKPGGTREGICIALLPLG
jgi:hypothetical protein